MNSPKSSVVVFDPSAWKRAFPAFSALSDEQAQFDFDLACEYLNNTPRSVVKDVKRREKLLWLLTAHIAQLSINNAQNGSQGGMVGRVSSASRRSVSISTDAGGMPGSAWWYAQTQYGASFWQATAWLRQMRFIPGRPHPARIFP